MANRKLLREIEARGVSKFENLAEVRSQQADMLDCLASSLLSPDRHVGLADCRADYCGRVNCLEACWFGTRRRRLEQIPVIYDLLQKSGTPLHEVRVVRGAWPRPAEGMAQVNIRVAKQLNRRLLEKLSNPTVVAVGMFKVFKAPDTLNWKKQPGEPEFSDPIWICEIHQIVAGAEKQELERAFYVPAERDTGTILSRFWLNPIEKLGDVIGDVFRRDLQGRGRPWLNAGAPKKPERRDYYMWLLTLRPNARLIRYGCDQYFNKLEGKKPRKFVAFAYTDRLDDERRQRLRHERRVRRLFRSK